MRITWLTVTLSLFGLAVLAADTPAKSPGTSGKAAVKTAPKAAKPATQFDQLSIQADTAEMDFGKHSAVFTGNVHVEDASMQLQADRMTVYLKQGNELKRIEAEGNVTIREAGSDRTAKAGKAVYDVAKDTITLTESPSLVEAGRGMMTKAEKFVYHLASQTFIATGRPQFIMLVKKGKTPTGGVLGLGHKNKEDKKGHK